MTERLSELNEITGIDPLLGWMRLGGIAGDLMLGHIARMRDSILPSLR